VDTGQLRLEPVVADFHTLNDKASRGELEVTAVSAHAYAYARQKYLLLRSGASFGQGYGPVIVAREPMDPQQLTAATVAVPGVTSSAYLVMGLWARVRTRLLPFDKILSAVEAGLVDCGLVVHEDKMKLELSGLTCVLDLAAWWAQQTDNLPLPLGCVVVRRNLPPDVQRQLERMVQESVRCGLAGRTEAMAAAYRAAGRLEAELMNEFITRYVTELSVDMGSRGRAALEEFLRRGHQAGIIPQALPLEFAPLE